MSGRRETESELYRIALWECSRDLITSVIGCWAIAFNIRTPLAPVEDQWNSSGRSYINGRFILRG